MAEGLLGRFDAGLGAPLSGGDVLVDGTWDNPNHWVRYTLFRAALGLTRGREVGLVGPYRVKECSQTFSRLGVKQVVSFEALRDDPRSYREEARRLLSGTSIPGEILQWSLPHGFPADFVYDGILKRQRVASVNLADHHLADYVGEALASLEAARRLLDAHDFRLVMLSHAINFQYAALAWMAVLRGIPVVVLYGEFGVCRFVKIRAPEEMWTATNRPTPADFDGLAAGQAEALAAAGLAYLEKRRSGGTSELAAILAYQKRTASLDRYAICEAFGWDPSRPIVAVYAANWFDLPHMYGMRHFVDFQDWLGATVSAAVANRRVNWLFKAHPCDDWYGGIRLSDLMPVMREAHIQQVPRPWNGAALMDAVDALVTYHGTAGIEFAALGKPVLLADRGWYHELGIARWARSRDEYLRELGTEWWKDLDLSETTRRARILAGWHFCRPDWQGGFVLEDDPVQDPIYERLPELWAGGADVIARELRTIREWFESPHRYYHTYKVSRADAYTS